MGPTRLWYIANLGFKVDKQDVLTSSLSSNVGMRVRSEALLLGSPLRVCLSYPTVV